MATTSHPEPAKLAEPDDKLGVAQWLLVLPVLAFIGWWGLDEVLEVLDAPKALITGFGLASLFLACAAWALLLREILGDD